MTTGGLTMTTSSDLGLVVGDGRRSHGKKGGMGGMQGMEAAGGREGRGNVRTLNSLHE